MIGNASKENYLEAILILSREKPQVRAVDIADQLGFSKPSVSIAMKKLRQSGHIQVSKEDQITLTPSGRAIAEMIYERHAVISTWLISIGVDPQTARTDACRMEHDLSPESFEKIKSHLKGEHFDVYEEAGRLFRGEKA